MLICFLRHGIAEDQRPGMTDSDRALTPHGADVMRREAEGIKRLGLAPQKIISSPLLRARQTAEIVAAALGMANRATLDRRLAYGCDMEILQQMIDELQPAEQILLVGHNPTFSELPGELVGGARLDLAWGGLLCVEIDRIESGRGILRLLLTPRALVEMAGGEA